MQGYIKDHRKELTSDIWLMPPLYHRVWQYLKYKVNYYDNEIPMRDGSKMLVKKGQHLTSIRGIAQAIGWYEGAKWKEPNPKTISAILDWLEKQNMIQVGRGKGNRQYTLITLINWDLYQSKEDEGNSKETVDGEAREQLVDINKEVKESNKKDKEDILNTSSPKRNKPVYDEDNSYMKMATYFLGKIKEWKPDYIFRGNMQTWADDFRKLSEIDKRSKQQIKELIDWVTSDSFWQINILSPKTLREKLNRLEAKMNGGGKRAASEGHFSGDTESNRKSITGGKTGRIGNYQPVSPIDLSDETII